MSDKAMEGKVAVVTGAGRGIGRAIATLMAQQGAAVVVNDIGAALDGSPTSEKPADEAVAEIRKAGGQAVANFDSVADFKSAKRIIEQAVDTFGRVDCVVNNAGILRDVIFHKMTEDDWDAVVGVMLKGAFNMCRNAAEHFREQQGGSFVHMTSTSGLIGAMGQANYSAAKLGMVALSKSIAVDMQKFNVRSNCIAPVAWTRMTQSVPPKDEATRRRIQQRMQITSEHNAPLAVYLASDLAAGINGQVFCIRKNEIFLMSQSRPLRGVHDGEGWTPQKLHEHFYPAVKSWFFPLERTADVFSWDSI